MVPSDLVSLSEYKEYKSITNTEEDSKRLALITSVSQMVETYCNRVFLAYWETPVKEYFSALNTEVYLSHFPIKEIESVKVSADGGLTYTELSYLDPNKNGYLVNKEDGLIYTQYQHKPFLYTVDRTFNSLEVVYTAGYEELPLDLKLAIFDLIHYYEHDERTPTKSMMSATMTTAIPYNDYNFPSHITRVLNMYRMPYCYREQ